VRRPTPCRRERVRYLRQGTPSNSIARATTNYGAEIPAPILAPVEAGLIWVDFFQWEERGREVREEAADEKPERMGKGKRASGNEWADFTYKSRLTIKLEEFEYLEGKGNQLH